ncbi:MAG: shikimate dehydrogenase [bacterium]
MITPSTKVCAIIGNPVEHSLSPLIHNAAFRECGIDYIYCAFRVIDENLKHAMNGFRALEQLKGLSITIPHKIQIMPYLDWIEGGASFIGSINTVLKEEDKVKGYNTDGSGAMEALKEAGIEINEKKIVIVGTGGVARGIAFNLLHVHNPHSLAIVGRTPEKVKRLENDLQNLNRAPITTSSFDQKSLQGEIAQADILIQCTSVGMWPHREDTPLPAEFLHKDLVVFDTIYTPLKTKLIMDAETKGCTVVPGLTMFINQACLQFTLWTKTKAPKAVMYKTALDALKE